MEPCNYGMRYQITGAGSITGLKQSESLAATQRPDIVCPVPGIADVDTSHFFNNIARRLPKKGLRVADNGFTTQH